MKYSWTKNGAVESPILFVVFKENLERRGIFLKNNENIGIQIRVLFYQRIQLRISFVIVNGMWAFRITHISSGFYQKRF